jgi:hypothetical protein
MEDLEKKLTELKITDQEQATTKLEEEKFSDKRVGYAYS